MELVAGYGSDSDESSGDESDTLRVKQRGPSQSDRGGAVCPASQDTSPAERPCKQPRLTTAQGGSGAQEKAEGLQTGAQKKSPPRKRTFPHVQGNYPSVVYIPVTQAGPLHLLFKQLKARASEQLGAALFPAVPQTPVHEDPREQQLPFHISLSRTVPVRQEQIAPLKSDLREQLSKCKRCPIGLKGLKAFANDDQSRSFVSLAMEEGLQEVCALIASVDKAFKSLGLPLFHEDPQPHVSLAWAAGEHHPQLTAAVQGDWADLGQVPLRLLVHQVVVQIGKIKTSISLAG